MSTGMNNKETQKIEICLGLLIALIMIFIGATIVPAILEVNIK